MSQQQQSASSQDSQDTENSESEDVTPHSADVDPEVNQTTESLLDEIDDVLESNAEEFVQHFHQKGGQ